MLRSQDELNTVPSDCDRTGLHKNIGLVGRDEHWTGLGLDWIRTITNSFEIGLEADCETHINLRSEPELDWVN